jgi:hypothetical protein
MTLLQGLHPRARWMRLGTAKILKRFYFCERSLVISCSAWLPLIGALEPKTLLPLFSWQNAQTANDLRERTFELRYPSRSMDEEGADRSLVELSTNSATHLQRRLSSLCWPPCCSRRCETPMKNSCTTPIPSPAHPHTASSISP